MLDVKLLRNEFEQVKARLRSRGEDISELDRFPEIDHQRREIIQEVEELKSKRNTVSQEVSVLKREKKDADHLIQEMKEVNDRIKVLDDQLREVEADLESILLTVPNILMRVFQWANQRMITLFILLGERSLRLPLNLNRIGK